MNQIFCIWTLDRILLRLSAAAGRFPRPTVARITIPNLNPHLTPSMYAVMLQRRMVNGDAVTVDKSHCFVNRASRGIGIVEFNKGKR